jgi:hypothetical protein
MVKKINLGNKATVNKTTLKKTNGQGKSQGGCLGGFVCESDCFDPNLIGPSQFAGNRDDYNQD